MSTSASETFYKIVYFTSIAGASILFGFSRTLNKYKKEQSAEVRIHEEGVALARRALMRATVYSVTGFAVFTLASYHLFGKQLIAKKSEEIRRTNETADNSELLKLLK